MLVIIRWTIQWIFMLNITFKLFISGRMLYIHFSYIVLYTCYLIFIVWSGRDYVYFAFPQKKVMLRIINGTFINRYLSRSGAYFNVNMQTDELSGDVSLSLYMVLTTSVIILGRVKPNTNTINKYLLFFYWSHSTHIVVRAYAKSPDNVAKQNDMSTCQQNKKHNIEN